MYRLADMVRGLFDGREFHYVNYPNSIATEYMKIKDKFPKRQKSLHFSKIDFKSLISIIKSKKYKNFEKPDSNTIIVHLRVGDVIDGTKLTADDFLHKSPTETKYKNGRNYVYNLDYYRHIITELPTSLKNIIFVYGFHAPNFKNYKKSEEYVAKLKTFFKSKG